MLSEVKTGSPRLGASLQLGPAMVRRSEGCSRGDRGFSTHLLGELSMTAGGTVGPVVDDGSDDGRCRTELDVWKL